MIKIYAYVLLLLTGFQVLAQEKTGPKLFLRNGTIVPEENVSTTHQSNITARKSDSEEQVFIIIQFNEIPSDAARAILQNADITLLEYIPENAYTAVANRGINMAALQNTNARSVVFLNPEQKVQPILLSNNIPDYATHGTDKVDVHLSFPGAFSFEELGVNLAEVGIEIISDALKSYQIMEVRIPIDSLRAVTRFPWIQYIELIPQPEEPLIDKSTTGTRANVLHSLQLPGYNLTGDGVVIGIGDYGNPKLHADVRQRVISEVPMPVVAHGQHMTGIAVGAGIINEKYIGYAPKALVISRPNSEIWKNAAGLVADFNMIATNNSYGPVEGGGGCPGFGSYTFYSYVLDRQAFELPFLQHVFAAGNSGLSAPCNGFPVGYGNVLGEYMSAKNVITVGQTQGDGVISPTSSRGPVQDGRIKPELTAPGTAIVSTVPNNAYQAGTGTSMAAPAVVGGIALLNQHYRQHNGNSYPKNALMKALLCNGAADQALTGPDYTYGFGNMNLLRSVIMLDKKQYFTGTLAHQASEVHQITVPSNTAELKVMLYWNDPAPSLLAGGKTLVNNLDLTLAATSAAAGSPVSNPLFPATTTPSLEAITGVDSVNNVEQIVIEKPAAGNYSLQVVAEKIPAGSQEYFLVYDIIESTTTITYPIGAERLAKGDVVNISWDSYGDKTSTFGILYSLDNGGSWTPVNTNVAANLRQFAWTVPDATTGQAKIRVIQNATGLTRDSNTFTIFGSPALSFSSAQCDGYAAIQWTAVPGATEYEVMILDGEQMKPVTRTTGLKYIFSGLSSDSTYFFSVRAWKDALVSRRAVAINRRPNSGNCAGNISDKDMKVESIVSPAQSGRMYTLTSLSGTQDIAVKVRNLDDQPTTGVVEVGYATGNGNPAVHWETIPAPVPGVGFLDYTFNKKADMQNPGTYPVKVFVKYSGDPIESNNVLSKTFKQIANPAMTLPYFQDVESVPAQQIITDKEDVAGADAYLYSKTNVDARFRTSVEPKLAYSGTKAFILDAQTIANNFNQSALTGTFNLSSYKVETDELVLTFRYQIKGPDYDKFYRVFIRGSENDDWVHVHTMRNYEELETDNGYYNASIDVSDKLKSAGQVLSSSFQVMWSLSSNYNAQQDGFIIDDIGLFKATSDLEIAKIQTPNVAICDYSSSTEFSIEVKNNGDADCYDVPVKSSSRGYTSYDLIPVIKKGSSALVKLHFPFSILTSGESNLLVWLEKPYDINRNNDSINTVVEVAPQITEFPYHQNFEKGSGGWYTEGANSSWQFGTPNSSKVNGAASGNNAWKTNLTGNYNSNELSYLYSPCFIIPFMENPRLSFSSSIDFAGCQAGVCDMAYVEYNLGNGWNRLGIKGDGTNWYNTDTEGSGVWSLPDYSRWHVSTIPMPVNSYQMIRFRFVVKTDGQTNGEGIAVDDIHVYDMPKEIFSQAPGSAKIEQFGVARDNWNFFEQNNRIVVAINPNNQDLGNSVSVQTFLNEGAIKNNNGQHYMNRNYIIKASNNKLADFVSVRLYFADSEMEKLLSAPASASVDKPGSAYDLAITKYSGDNEDGDLMNNAESVWSFYPKSAITKVPYGQGYYLEFKTRTFSEFWLGKDYIGTGIPLPVELISFSAKKSNAADGPAYARLDWKTASEKSFSHFEIQMAEGNEKMLRGEFATIGTLEGAGDSRVENNYTFADRSLKDNHTYYYRLKMIDTDKSIRYSAVRAVNFEQQQSWRVFPNPSDGKFNIEFKADKGERVKFNVNDLNGRLIKSTAAEATGSVQKHEIILSPAEMGSGLYIIQAISEDAGQTFKVIVK